jgi:hypothetical protein
MKIRVVGLSLRPAFCSRQRARERTKHCAAHGNEEYERPVSLAEFFACRVSGVISFVKARLRASCNGSYDGPAGAQYPEVQNDEPDKADDDTSHGALLWLSALLNHSEEALAMKKWFAADI